MIGTTGEIPATGDMTLSSMLFSFEGRINRAKYWAYTVPLALILTAGIMIDIFATQRVGAGYAISLFITLWTTISINIKRCHDRDKSGWFYLVALVPIVNIWYLVETGFLKGTEGSNKYGPNPLTEQSDKREEQLESWKASNLKASRFG